jgi:hypothetical protein
MNNEIEDLNEKVAAFLTAKSVATCVNAGGTQSWALDPYHVKRCRYAVLCRNLRADWGDGMEPHRTAFMIGHISGVEPSSEGSEGRWLVTFDEYAVINISEAWKGWRNPVRYTTFKELGITRKDLEAADFKDIPERYSEKSTPSATQTNGKMTIAEAKRAVAANYGVKPESVEITIRG